MLGFSELLKIVILILSFKCQELSIATNCSPALKLISHRFTAVVPIIGIQILPCYIDLWIILALLNTIQLPILHLFSVSTGSDQHLNYSSWSFLLLWFCPVQTTLQGMQHSFARYDGVHYQFSPATLYLAVAWYTVLFSTGLARQNHWYDDKWFSIRIIIEHHVGFAHIPRVMKEGQYCQWYKLTSYHC